MHTERSRWLTALALGVTGVFDLTGAVIYRVMRASLPPAPARPAAGAFEQATAELLDARREAVSRTHDEDGVSLPA